MPTKLTASELAQQYGWALSFLKSDKSLWTLFQRAVKAQWTPDKFVAQLKTTKWWKTNSESVRQAKYLKATDPATYNARMTALRSQIADAAAQMGGNMSLAQMTRVANNALMFNWNESQIRNALAGYVRAVNGVYRGDAASSVEELRQVAWRNGVSLSSPTLQSWVQNIAKGTATVEGYKAQIRKQAQSLAPGFAQELQAGLDLFDIANPYIEAKAKILEMNPADIDLFDNDVRKALSSKTNDGKATSMSLWEYENSLRRKPEWLKTQNAQDSVMSTARQVLRDFGFMGA